MDCTDAVHVVRFPHGLTYIDLPGVASDDELENFNRVALGMAQNPQWPQASELRFFDYDWREQTGQTAYPAEAVPVGAVAPDLILYLIAPQLQLAKDEQPYLGDLLRRYGPEHLVYVLNMFHGPSGGQIATEQNLADVRLKLDALYQEAGLVLDPGQLVSVDCRTGAGLADLLDRISRQLGPDRGQPLTEVIAYQSERAPALYGDEIRASVARYAAALAPGVPPSDEQGREELLAAAQQLAAFAWDITGQSAVPSGPVARALENLAAEIVHELRQEITEPILKKRSEKRYIDVPIEKRITEDDPSRPIYETRRRKRKIPPRDVSEFIDAIGNAWNGDGFAVDEWTSDRVLVGYEQTVRTVITGYREEHVGTDRWTEEVGRRVVNVIYDAYGARGVAMVVTAWHAALLSAFGQPPRAKGIRAGFRHIRAAADSAMAVSQGNVPDDLFRAGTDPLARDANRYLQALLNGRNVVD